MVPSQGGSGIAPVGLEDILCIKVVPTKVAAQEEAVLLVEVVVGLEREVVEVKGRAFEVFAEEGSGEYVEVRATPGDDEG